MTYIQSLKDLARAKEEAEERQRENDQKYQYHLKIGISSCSIAVGARDTLATINRLLAERNLSKVKVTQTGCIGLCALEPIVQLKSPDQTITTYGRVSPKVAQRIIDEHIVNNRIIQEYVVEDV